MFGGFLCFFAYLHELDDKWNLSKSYTMQAARLNSVAKPNCFATSQAEPAQDHPRKPKAPETTPRTSRSPRQPHATPKTRRPQKSRAPRKSQITRNSHKTANSHKQLQATPASPNNPRQPEQPNPRNSDPKKTQKNKQKCPENNLVLMRSQCLWLALIRDSCESKLYARASIYQCLRPRQATGAKI